ncbi:Transcriptional regulatory protein FixJ [compost metagenome]
MQHKFDQLSEREREVMENIIEGKTSKEIARVLALSPRTVEAHRANIFSKLAVTSLAQLVKEHETLNFLSKTT